MLGSLPSDEVGKSYTHPVGTSRPTQLYMGTSVWYAPSQSKGSRVLGTLSERREDHYGQSAAAGILHDLRATTGAWRCLLCRLWHAGEPTINGSATPVFCFCAARLSAAPPAGAHAPAR